MTDQHIPDGVVTTVNQRATNPLEAAGIKLLDGWKSEAVPGGVVISKSRILFVSTRPREPWEWEAILRPNNIGFERTANGDGK